MSKQALAEGFSQRLCQAMQNSGFLSTRSKSGVCVQALAKLTQHSRQICRKYLMGQSIPEPEVLIRLAKSLNVSAGWLLFGEELPQNAENIIIHTQLLAYILNHPMNPVRHEKNSKSLQFLSKFIHNISQLHGDQEQLKNIIDITFSSAQDLSII